MSKAERSKRNFFKNTCEMEMCFVVCKIPLKGRLYLSLATSINRYWGQQSTYTFSHLPSLLKSVPQQQNHFQHFAWVSIYQEQKGKNMQIFHPVISSLFLFFFFIIIFFYLSLHKLFSSSEKMFIQFLKYILVDPFVCIVWFL